jgi:hypothetical protein
VESFENQREGNVPSIIARRSYTRALSKENGILVIPEMKDGEIRKTKDSLIG